MLGNPWCHPEELGGKQMSADLASGFSPDDVWVQQQSIWRTLQSTCLHGWLRQAQRPKAERYLHRYIKISGNRIDEEMSDEAVVKTECELVHHFQAWPVRRKVVSIVCAFVSLTSTSKVFSCSETCRAVSFISTFLSLVLQKKSFFFVFFFKFINQCLRASLYHSKKYYSAPRSCWHGTGIV